MLIFSNSKYLIFDLSNQLKRWNLNINIKIDKIDKNKVVKRFRNRELDLNLIHLAPNTIKCSVQLHYGTWFHHVGETSFS